MPSTLTRLPFFAYCDPTSRSVSSSGRLPRCSECGSWNARCALDAASSPPEPRSNLRAPGRPPARRAPSRRASRVGLCPRPLPPNQQSHPASCAGRIWPRGRYEFPFRASRGGINIGAPTRVDGSRGEGDLRGCHRRGRVISRAAGIVALGLGRNPPFGVRLDLRSRHGFGVARLARSSRSRRARHLRAARRIPYCWRSRGSPRQTPRLPNPGSVLGPRRGS